MVVGRFDKSLYTLFSDKYRVLHHVLFWMVYFFDFYSNIAIAAFDPNKEISEFIYTTKYWVYLTDFIIIYINLYLIIPYFLMKDKFGKFFILSFLSFVFDITISVYNCDCLPEGYGVWDFLYKFVNSSQNTIFFAGSAIGLKWFKIWIKTQKRIKDLENESLKTELNYLKSQMNPHFLFNTLNNIYVQTKIDHVNASQTILKLSDLLRYQLYDCSKDRVKLSSEIDYLKNYLELERIRKSKIQINFNIDGKVNGLMIPPFIFIPFIENAIKHGTTGADAYINIDLSIHDKELIFVVKNSVHETIRCVSQGGLGLANVKRRLQLLFTDRHDLIIEESKNAYNIKLILDLS